MQAKSFGKIAVPTTGTPVRLTTDTTLRVARLRFAAVIGETGRVFLGVAGMNKATGAGVIKEFWPTGAGGGVADQRSQPSRTGTCSRPRITTSMPTLPPKVSSPPTGPGDFIGTSGRLTPARCTIAQFR
jgi:hypothetical protein